MTSDTIEPGWWYLRTDYDPGYCIVHVMRVSFGPCEGELRVFETDSEMWHEVQDYGEDRFICRVPPPSEAYRE